MEIAVAEKVKVAEKHFNSEHMTWWKSCKKRLPCWGVEQCKKETWTSMSIYRNTKTSNPTTRNQPTRTRTSSNSIWTQRDWLTNLMNLRHRRRRLHSRKSLLHPSICGRKHKAHGNSLISIEYAIRILAPDDWCSRITYLHFHFRKTVPSVMLMTWMKQH